MRGGSLFICFCSCAIGIVGTPGRAGGARLRHGVASGGGFVSGRRRACTRSKREARPRPPSLPGCRYESASLRGDPPYPCRPAPPPPPPRFPQPPREGFKTEPAAVSHRTVPSSSFLKNARGKREAASASAGEDKEKKGAARRPVAWDDAIRHLQ